MPFLRVENKASGAYLRIPERYQDDSGDSGHRTLYSPGKTADYAPEQLRRIGIRFFEPGGGEVKALLNGEVREEGRCNYGYRQIFGKALQHYGLADVLRKTECKSRMAFSLYDCVLLLLPERLAGLCSKCASHPRTLPAVYAGFLAISTNHTSPDTSEILEQYKQLYKIEHSFRTFKSHLETRPMFHWANTRTDGHICLRYLAFGLQNPFAAKGEQTRHVTGLTKHHYERRWIKCS